jgi:hypothetical protein
MTKPIGILCLVLLSCAFVFFVDDSRAADPCRSGLQPGQRPGPYSAVISTGTQRGQSYCYICETGERPAIIVFARTLSDPLGKLAEQLEKAVTDHQKAELRSWITFLSDDQLNLDPKLVQWSRKHALRSVPLGVFEDVGGPPSYRLAREADLTVLLFVKQKVVANFAFRTGELNDAKIAEILKAVPRLVSEKK